MAPAMMVRMLSVGKRVIFLMPERPALSPVHESATPWPSDEIMP